VLRDNLQNTINRKVIKQLEFNLNSIEVKFRELYKQKKKFSWNWFTGNKNSKEQTPKNKLSELETLQLSLIEYYFLIGCFDMALSELKSLSESLTVGLIRNVVVILLLKFWSSTYMFPF
jgi:hypothetical protein